MKKNGDARKPMDITELTWPAAKGERLTRTYGYEVNTAGQAKRLGQVVPMLVENRRKLKLARIYLYTWISAAPEPTERPVLLLGPAPAPERRNDGDLAPVTRGVARMAHRYE